ncbi:MAG TPA: isoprenylcysteine carboxylmethyltransferase family protein [Anaerolineales bacterium]|nr:isoprenylcysteine carboxylmethyltransferase family protein [Anaerolineales bacterium]
MSSTPWWKGARGEWYVVAQIALLVLMFLSPRTWPGSPVWHPIFTWLGTAAGSFLLLAGVLLFISAIFRLGPNLTPVPYPKEQGTLIETGPYRLVRHPIYSGVILGVFGWAFLAHGWITLGYAIVILVFLDIKSRREEQWLREKFLDYAAYKKHVAHKLIPFLY